MKNEKPAFYRAQNSGMVDSPTHLIVISPVMLILLQFLVCRPNCCCSVIVTVVLHSGGPWDGSYTREEIVAHFP
jgi:hypothetical protein